MHAFFFCKHIQALKAISLTIYYALKILGPPPSLAAGEGKIDYDVSPAGKDASVPSGVIV